MGEELQITDLDAMSNNALGEICKRLDYESLARYTWAAFIIHQINLIEVFLLLRPKRKKYSSCMNQF